MNASTHKQTTALNLAIESLERERRKLFAAGEHAYLNGIRAVSFEGNGVKGETLGFSDSGHEGYTKYTDAIQELLDLIEIVQDPGVTVESNQMEMFEEDR